MFPKLTISNKRGVAGYHDVKLNGVIIGFAGDDGDGPFLVIHSSDCFTPKEDRSYAEVETMITRRPVERAICVTIKNL